MLSPRNLRWLALAALVSAVGCGRCRSSATTASGGASPDADAATTAAADDAGTASDAAALPTDVPEVKDTGNGRATAALRAVLTAYGIAFDAATIERECNVDDDGASFDDLEEVAVKYGLEAGSVTMPVEHVLLPEAKMLPAILMIDAAEDQQEFVLAWRLDGDRVQVMSPDEGRKWIPRAELEKSLHVLDSPMPLDELREAFGAPDFASALEARMLHLGVDATAGRALLARAAADPGWRGLAALDASIRKVAAFGPNDAGHELVSATFGCAFEKACEGVSPVPAALWSVQPAPNGPRARPRCACAVRCC